MTKRDRIEVLLATMDAPYPTPQGPLSERLSGIDASKVPCAACRGKGKRPRRVTPHGRPHPVVRVLTCEVCDGAKYRKARKGEDGVDPYTFEPAKDAVEGFDVDPKRLRTLGVEHDARGEMRARDASIARLRSNARARKGILDPHEQYGWERERARWDKAGDYPKLRRLLGHKPAGAEPVAWLVEVWQGTPRVPWWLLPKEDATVDDLVAKGWKASRIAREKGLTLAQAKKLVKEAA